MDAQLGTQVAFVFIGLFFTIGKLHMIDSFLRSVHPSLPPSPPILSFLLSLYPSLSVPFFNMKSCHFHLQIFSQMYPIFALALSPSTVAGRSFIHVCSVRKCSSESIHALSSVPAGPAFLNWGAKRGKLSSQGTS